MSKPRENEMGKNGIVGKFRKIRKLTMNAKEFEKEILSALKNLTDQEIERIRNKIDINTDYIIDEDGSIIYQIGEPCYVAWGAAPSANVNSPYKSN